MPSADGPAGLRVGVLCEGMTIPAWQARCLEAVFAVPGVEPALVIVDSHERNIETGDARRRLTRPRSGGTGRPASRSRALRPVDAGAWLGGLPRVRVDAPELSAVIASVGLDLLLQIAPRPAPASLVLLAPRGVWSVHSSGNPAGADGTTGYREIVEGSPVTIAELRCRRGSNRETVVIGQAFFRTRSDSHARTVDDVLFGAAELAARACRTILAGADPVLPEAPHDDCTPRKSGRDTFTFAARQRVNFVRGQLAAIALSPQWNVGFVDAPIQRFLEPSFAARVRWLPKAARGNFLADPFGLPDGSAAEWLVESYDYRTDLGVITAVEAGRPSGTRSLLPVSTHASYPYLLRHRGEVYCVPQLTDAGGVRIFRAVSYPREWVDAGELIARVDARDPTPFRHGDRWWLAFTDAAEPMTDLHLWWSDDLFGEWHPHAANPVKIDVRSARPAGTPFVHEGLLYRPAQDCSESYGGGVAICRVDRLTPTEFREEVVRVLRSFSGRYRRGTHTLSSVGEGTLVDGKRLVFSFAGTRRALASRVQRTSS